MIRPVVVLLLDEQTARDHIQALRNDAYSYAATHGDERASRLHREADRVERQLLRSTFPVAS